MKPKRIGWAALVVLLVLLVAACDTDADGDAAADPDTVAAGGERGDIEIIMITHGQAADPFWSVVANGANQAAEDVGVSFTYNAPDSFDMVEMSSLIEAAIARDPDGLAVSIPDADGLRDAITEAVGAGIPVVSLNSGDDVFEELGIVAHVGQSERLAGFRAGEEIAAAGATNAVCINHEQGNVALDLRCEGFIEAIEESGGEARQLAVEGTDEEGSRERIQATLSEDETIDGFLAGGPLSANPALAALRELDMVDDVAFGTFDLGPDILRAIDEGDMLFAIDQQQYLQGYLPVVMLTNNAEMGAMPVGEILTGPGFVFQEDAADVIEWSEEGLR